MNRNWHRFRGHDLRIIYFALGVLLLGIVTGLIAAAFKGWYYP